VPEKGGQEEVVSGQWPVGEKAAEEGPVVSGQWPVASGQWSVAGGQ